MDLEDWRALVDYWIARDKDLEHLNIPTDVAHQLELPMEDTMTESEEGATPSVETSEVQVLKFKRKKYFEGDKCGYVDCSRAADGYVAGLKPTGKEGTNRLWYGPACIKCVRKWNASLAPLTLAELAHQRGGSSDLAFVLDVEVGEVLRRLAAAGVDDQGRKLEGAPAAPVVEVVSTPADSVALAMASINVPTGELKGEVHNAQGVVTDMTPFHIHDQDGMDLVGAILADVKGIWKRLEAARLALGAPLRDRLKDIQAHYNPPLVLLVQAEALLKIKIKEGTQRLAASQAAALAAAQAAYQANNPAAMAQATQAAIASEVALPQGVTARLVRKWRIINGALVPVEMYSSFIDPKKVQAAIDLGHTQIPGIEIYDESNLASRAS